MTKQEPPSVKEMAHAKVNLYLHITGRRDNGYHELDTLFAFTEFGDRLTVFPAEEFSLSHEGALGHLLPEPEQNIIWRAAHLLAKEAGIHPGARIVLEKYIPTAAGLGGGSADAAAALRGLSKLWNLQLSDPKMYDIALQLGADVPACLESEAALADGIGDRLHPVQIPSCGVLLLNPMVSLETHEVFGARREAGGALCEQNQPMEPMHNFIDLIDILRVRGNDLEGTAVSLRPVIDAVLKVLRSLSSVALVRMSGSGATCFALFETSQQAETAAVEVSSEHPDWWAQASTLLSRPVHQGSVA